MANDVSVDESKNHSEYRKQYYQKNKEKCDEYTKAYYHKNIEQRREYARNYYKQQVRTSPLVLCKCGQYIRKATMRTHIKTKRHFDHLALLPQTE